MAEQYDASDFNHHSHRSNRNPDPFSVNSNGPLVEDKQEPQQQRASSLANFLTGGIAQEAPGEQQDQSGLPLEEFQERERLRSQLSNEEYQQASEELQKEKLTRGRDSNGSVSPTTNPLRVKIAKAFGGDREH